MKKNWKSLGLMSGTSGDGVDASIIETNGTNQYQLIKDKYYEYDSNIFKDIHSLKEKIHRIEDLEIFNKEINDLEILILSCYSPLYSFDWCKIINPSNEFEGRKRPVDGTG